MVFICQISKKVESVYFIAHPSGWDTTSSQAGATIAWVQGPTLRQNVRHPLRPIRSKLRVRAIKGEALQPPK
jgi:hypothetical protein